MELGKEDLLWARQTWEKLDRKLRTVTKVPKLAYTTENGVYDDKAETNVNWWTNGFHHAKLWLLYDVTGYEPYKQIAQACEKKLEGAFANAHKLDHDVGFLWHITSGLNYKITGDLKARNMALLAADVLASRFNPKGGFLQAWNGTFRGQDARGFAIIDCMMNIPLLYWAAKEFNQPRYAYIAQAHADKTMKNHIRPDGCSRHIVDYDMQTGEFKAEYGGQGYEENSAWTRGQGWAIYGFALSYRHTGKQAYLDTACRVADHFLASLPADGLVPCDFRSPAEPKYYDDSAAMIAACGMIEIAQHMGQAGKRYLDGAVKLVKDHVAAFADWSDTCESVMQAGTVAYHFERQNIHLCYSDYYLTEALYRLTGHDREIW